MSLSLKEAERWLNGIEIQTDVDMDAAVGMEVMKLFGNSGFAYLLGLMLGERQGLYVMLAQLNLDDSVQRNLASVTQGQIKGLDRLRQTLLEIVSNHEAQNPTEKEQVNV